MELMIGMTLTVALMVATGSLMRDYMASAKTVRVATEANSDLLQLLRDVRRTFQTSVSRAVGAQRRACVLQYNNGGDDADLNNYSCNPAAVNGLVPTAGIGFGLDAAGVPRQAYVNACEPIPAAVGMPTGRSGRPFMAPLHPTQLNDWGGTADICPARDSCPAGTRPVVKFLTRRNNVAAEIAQRQVPRQIVQAGGAGTRASLNHWGAMVCAAYFSDVQRNLQGLFGENAGSYLPDYMTVTVFLARGRFDILPPLDPNPPPDAAAQRLSEYIWIHGGLTLEFNDGQEMSVYRCPPAPPGGPNPVPGC